MENKTKPIKRFLSLKWKALLFFSLALLLINASFPYFSHQNLMQHFENRRIAAHQHSTEEFKGLREQTVKRLQQFGGIIPSLKGVEQALSQRQASGLREAFDDHWPLLQLDMGIDLVHFYNQSGQILAQWGLSEQRTEDLSLIQGWLAEVQQKEKPITAISCQNSCTQYVLSPMLSAEGHNIGTLLLGASMAEVILNFNQISGRDVGILIDEFGGLNQTEGTVPESIKNISSWQKHIAALTNMELTLPLLQSLAEKNPDFETMKKGQQIVFNQQDYEIRLIPLSGLSVPGSGHLIVIDNISETLQEIRGATRDSLAGGVIGLLISEALLLAILWLPLSRLRLITDTLPLLGKGQFAQVREIVLRRNRRSVDEIDILNDTAISLSFQLETLEKDVQQHSLSLSERMEELASEKDFITHLLDTAHVIILTQNRQGKVMLLNQHGHQLTRYSDSELSDKYFQDFIPTEDLTLDLKRDLQLMTEGKKDQLSHEAILVCKNRSNRHILWFHSKLDPKGENEPVVLSVGLDLTARKQAELQLSWLADHDPLTGLFNRRRFQTELGRILAESGRYERSGALLFFDLDQFKYVNDTRGHHAGDALLKVVASQLSRLVRSTDIISRLGGDEFALVISESDEAGAVEVAHKIIEYLDDVDVPILERSYKVSASIGIALFPQHGKTVQELLSNADLAMYQAKESGRGRWHQYTGKEPILARMKARLFWKDRIQKALEEDRFVMYYQPVQHIIKGSISYYEALIRMKDPDGQIIAPGAFIPIAEQSGLIYDIDHLVLEKVIRHHATLKTQGLDIGFSLNLSAYAFGDPDLLPHLKKVLHDTGADPSRFTIEITETAAVSDLVAACSLMQEIKSLGCRFALDDFGTGFSSFAYLKQLPVDIVKIGDSFIKEIANHPDDQIFVKSLAEVTKGLGKQTVAEGVEDETTLRLLQTYSVDYAQGYYVGRPAPKLLEETRDQPTASIRS